MFNSHIISPPFCDGIASTVFNEVVKRIEGDRPIDDTLWATSRALLYRRLEEKNEKLYVRYNSTTLTDGDWRYIFGNNANNPPVFYSYLFDNSEIFSCPDHQLIVVESWNARFSHSFLNNFDAATTVYPQFIGNSKRLKDVEAFVRQKVKEDIRCYSDPNRKVAMIFTKKMSPQLWHIIQAFIPKYLPWLFKDSPVTELEQAMLKALTERYSPKYISALTEIYQQFDVKTLALEKSFHGFNSAFAQDTLANINVSISGIEREMESLQEKLSKLCGELATLRLGKLGAEVELQTGTSAADQLLIDYFTNSQVANLVSAKRGVLTYYVCSTIETWNFVDLENTFNDSRSWFNCAAIPTSAKLTRKQMKRLLIALFKDRRFKLRMCAGFKANPVRYTEYVPQHDFGFPTEVRKTYMPNPHLNEYQCLGNIKDRVRDAVKERDWFGLLELTVSITKGLNFSDNTVTHTFVNQLYNEPNKCIEAPDGTLLTQVEACKILEEEDKVKVVAHEQTV